MLSLLPPVLAMIVLARPVEACPATSGTHFRPHAISSRRHTTYARRSSSCLRFELLQRREALLHDFLVRARTETPEFSDERSYRFAVGVTIGPVIVTRDFVGSPIIRARVQNLRGGQVSFVLEAAIQSGRGARTGASAVVVLRAHETRTVELLCPDNIIPKSLTWSTMPL